MAKNYYGSIRFDDLIDAIKTGKIETYVSEQTGKRYVNISVWINDEENKFGQIGSVQLQNKQDFKDDEKFYIANLKQGKSMELREINPNNIGDDEDDLPF